MGEKLTNDQTQIIDVLKKVFGFQSFRPNQEEIISNILNRHDVFAVMPTGVGVANLERYGEEFIKAVRTYIDEYPHKFMN